MRRTLPLLIFCVALAGACSSDDEGSDAGRRDGGKDAVTKDGKQTDGKPADAKPVDAKGVDQDGQPDQSTADQALVDGPVKDQPQTSKDQGVLPDVKQDVLSSNTIGPSGGTLVSGDGKAELVVWAGSLSSTVAITIAPAVSPPSGALGQAYSFSPSSTTFSKNAVVRLAYDPKILGSVPASSLRVAVLQSGGWQVDAASGADTKVLRVTSEVAQLGTFAVVCPGCKLDAGLPDAAADGGIKDGIKDGPQTDGSASCKHPVVSQSCLGGWCYIPAGCFMMGSPTSESCRTNDEDQHAVTLTHGFEMMETSVTQGDFNKLMNYNPSKFSSCGNSCPVETVSWHEAAAYCNAMSQQKGLSQCYSCVGSKQFSSCQVASKYSGAGVYKCPGYRLPTEAEWEYASRAGTTTQLYNGSLSTCKGTDSNAGLIAWYAKNSGKTTHKVMQKLANKWGLYDMAGNVYDWTNDWYIKNLGSAPVTDPIGTTLGSVRAYRGGSWYCDAETLRAARRASTAPSSRLDYLGVRCVRSK